MEGYITNLVPWEKKKVKVYIDDRFRFFLYSNEIKRLKIQQDEEISEDIKPNI